MQVFYNHLPSVVKIELKMADISDISHKILNFQMLSLPFLHHGMIDFSSKYVDIYFQMFTLISAQKFKICKICVFQTFW